MKTPKTRGCDLDGVFRRIFEEPGRDKQIINGCAGDGTDLHFRGVLRSEHGACLSARPEILLGVFLSRLSQIKIVPMEDVHQI